MVVRPRFEGTVDASVEVGLALRKRLKEPREPTPAIHQAIIAPKGPMAAPKVRGKQKMPAPIIKPTTSADSERATSFVRTKKPPFLPPSAPCTWRSGKPTISLSHVSNRKPTDKALRQYRTRP